MHDNLYFLILRSKRPQGQTKGRTRKKPALQQPPTSTNIANIETGGEEEELDYMCSN